MSATITVNDKGGYNQYLDRNFTSEEIEKQETECIFFSS